MAGVFLCLYSSHLKSPTIHMKHSAVDWFFVSGECLVHHLCLNLLNKGKIKNQSQI